MESEKIIQLMSQRRLFEGASQDVLGELVAHGKVISIQEGTHLIEQGKIGQAVWVLLEGAVLIIVDDVDSHELDCPGTILGEISAVSHTAATATVKAASDILALQISHKSFHQALQSSQQLASSVLRSMSKYL